MEKLMKKRNVPQKLPSYSKRWDGEELFQFAAFICDWFDQVSHKYYVMLKNRSGELDSINFRN